MISPPRCRGEGTTAARSAGDIQGKVLGSSLPPQQPFPFAIPVVLIHRTGNPTNRWHLGRKADKLAPTCRSTKSFQSRRALARQEPRGVEMPEESAVGRLPRGSTAPAPSSPGGRHAAGSLWELVAGGDRHRVLNRMEEAIQAEHQRSDALFRVSTTLRFGGLAACSEKVFVGPH